METWLIIGAIALVTYSIRAVPLLANWRTDHPLISRLIQYIPPAILAALVVPDLLAPDGALQGGARLWAGLAATAVAWITRSITLTMIAGMVVFTWLRWQFGL